MADVERSKRDLESNVQRKEREIGEAVSRLEAEQGLVSKQQRMIKEIQGKYSVHKIRHLTYIKFSFLQIFTKFFEQILLFHIIFSGLFLFLIILRH